METIERLKKRELKGSVLHADLQANEEQYDDPAQSGRSSEEANAASIEGIWTGEIFGPHGWENNGTYMLNEGRVLGGNNRHYSVGHYSFADDSYRAEIFVHYHGQPRTIFGERDEKFEIVVIGTLKNGIIEAQISRRDKPGHSVRFRMTRRMDLPSGNRYPEDTQ